MNDSGAEAILDLRGLACPLPVLKARKALARLAPSAVLIVETTDPMAAIDIPHLCREEGHRLLAEDAAGEVRRFRIERGRSPA
ncbi:MAG TPA: sulfurtransferase TusA family protein [Bauldia sp.]|nr:sulfurtransferase TusA family protein [Bauldia sp.]